MDKTLLLFFILWSFKNGTDSKIIVENEVCNSEDKYAKVFYDSYFSMARTVMITQFINNETDNNNMNYLVNFFGQFIKQPKTFRKVNLNKDVIFLYARKTKIFSIHRSSYFIIFIEDGDQLKKIIGRIKWPTRVTFLIIFTTSEKRYCENVVAGINSSLTLLSKKGYIFNLMAHAPCSCKQNVVHIYLPFERNAQNHLGSTKTVRIKRLILNNHSYFWKRSKKFMNLNGYPVKVSIFKRIPSVMDDPNEIFNSPSKWNQCSHKCGVDINVLINLSKFMNFTIEVDDDPNVYYGNFYENGNVTGALGKVVRKEVDLAANGRFVDNSKQIEYSTPIDIEEMCIVVAKASKKPSWTAIFKCFNTPAWLLILVIEITCLIFWQLLQKTKYSWMIIYGISITITTVIPKRSRFKYFLVAFMMYAVIINTIFQGNLVKSYGKVQYYSDLTLNDFIKSKIKIYTTYIHMFEDIEIDSFKKLNNKIVDSSASNISNIFKIETNNDHAALERKSDAKFIINSHFLDSKGYPNLHVISDCPRSFFIAYAFQENSPYTGNFNKVLLRLVEGGFISKWKDSLTTNNTSSDNESQARVLPLHDIIFAFYILAGGTIVAITTFLLEIYWNCEERTMKSN